MTTLAAKDGCLAADTQLTGEYAFRVQKIVRLIDGGVAGGAGQWSKAYPILAWMVGGEQGEPPKFKGADLLIVRPDGTLWLAEGEWPPYPLLDKEAAIGSGAQGAMLAMRNGASAGDAVKSVAKIDPYTSDPVQMLKIEPAPKKRGLRSVQ